jgi:cell division protein ZipA
MEENFRNTLIIISAIIIGAFFVHGIWTIRKNKNPYKLKTKPNAKTRDEKLSSQSRDFDRSGFDQDGVGQVKVKNGSEKETLSPTPTDSETPIEDLLGKAMAAESKETEMPSFSAEYNDVATESEQQTTVNNEPLDNPELESILKNAAKGSEKPSKQQVPKQEQAIKAKATVKVSKPLYQEPVIHPKPSGKAKMMTKAELKRDQIEINFV